MPFSCSSSVASLRGQPVKQGLTHFGSLHSLEILGGGHLSTRSKRYHIAHPTSQFLLGTRSFKSTVPVS